MMDVTITPDKQTQLEKINRLFLWVTWLVTRQLSKQFQAFGLTQPQYLALVALTGSQQSYTMHHLAELMIESPPTLTGIIDRLVKMNLVQRNRCENDRRAVHVQATQTGHTLVNEIDQELMKDNVARFDNLSDDDRTIIAQYLTRILTSE